MTEKVTLIFQSLDGRLYVINGEPTPEQTRLIIEYQEHALRTARAQVIPTSPDSISTSYTRSARGLWVRR